MIEHAARAGARWLALFALYVAACSPDVVVPAGGGGGGGAGTGGQGGGGGSPPVATRSLTVRVERRLSDWGLSTYPLEGLTVFASDPEGALLSTAVTGKDGSAELQAADNGFVTAVSLDEQPCINDDCEDRLLSVRVVPAAQSLRLPAEARDAKSREPMSLKVEWDPIEDALYTVSWSCENLSNTVLPFWLPSEQSSVEIPDVVACPGSDEIAVAIDVQTPPPEDGPYAITQFGYVDGLPYVAGGALTVHVALQPGAEATLLVTGGPHLVQNLGYARLLPGVGVGLNGSWQQQWVNGGTWQLSTTVAPAFPELPRWLHAYPNTECAFTDVVEVGTGDGQITVDAERLAGVIPMPGAVGTGKLKGAWKLLDGEIGDAVFLDSSWTDEQGHVVWEFLEPVKSEGEGVPLLELPPDLHTVLGTPPADLVFGVRHKHIDVVEALDFPTFLELYDSDRYHRQESTSWTCEEELE
ncbi:MAG: hypothetical protein JNK04_22985 [Myxococcales bacterium]|nr:hypothetical protein [Myxococcales bacterium]